MHLKFLVSAAIAFIAITLMLGYFGLSSSISGIRFKGLSLGNAPEIQATSTAELPPPKNAAPLPPANPEKKSIEIPKVVFPKFPIADGTPTIPATPTKPAVPAPTIPATPAPYTPAPTPSEPAEEEEIDTAKSFTEGAVVNILCYAVSSPFKKSISGSGVIIDSRGIILTVAHVGHYFLLENYPSEDSADCIIRTGSPAKIAYDAELIYVSPDWVKKNAGALAIGTPQGNGQNDYALLAITKSLTSKKLPSSFTSVPLSNKAPGVGDDVALGTYGAEFLTGSQIQNALYPTSVEGTIANVYTYGGKTTDVISVKGSKAAQSGSSGGGIVNADDRFVGLITTSSLTGGTAQRTLYAITPDYIRANFKANTGESLDSYLKGKLSTLVENFKDEIPDLAQLVWNAIN